MIDDRDDDRLDELLDDALGKIDKVRPPGRSWVQSGTMVETTTYTFIKPNPEIDHVTALIESEVVCVGLVPEKLLSDARGTNQRWSAEDREWNARHREPILLWPPAGQSPAVFDARDVM